MLLTNETLVVSGTIFLCGTVFWLEQDNTAQIHKGEQCLEDLVTTVRMPNPHQQDFSRKENLGPLQAVSLNICLTIFSMLVALILFNAAGHQLWHCSLLFCYKSGFTALF